MIFILARNILGTDYCMSVAKSILFRKPKELKVGTIAFLADRLYVGVFYCFSCYISFASQKKRPKTLYMNRQGKVNQVLR